MILKMLRPKTAVAADAARQAAHLLAHAAPHRARGSG